ncbi:MAG: hypothetical protein VSS75_017825 [Candidatus Parabeggiatoa sp.]|nr:hypothetical protein [Candidatus Parabeggiatoa sp.]
MPNLVILVAIYIGLSFFVALLGMNRKWGFWGYFFSSLLLSPFMGILLVLASDPRRSDKT